MKADKIVLETQTAEQRVAAYAFVRDAKWTVEVDASIVRMRADDISFAMIASKLGNGLKENDIKNRWYKVLKKSSGITKPPAQRGVKISITWTEEVDASIVRMRADDISFAKIASELGNGLSKNDILNRWNRHLKDKLQRM